MSGAHIVIVTWSRSAPGATALVRSFTSIGVEATIVLLADGCAVASQIDEASEVIFRIGSASVLVYRNVVLPKLRNERHKTTLVKALDAFDKGTQAHMLRSRDVPMPGTRIISRVSDLEDWIPCVLKQPAGNRGDGVFLVHNTSDSLNISQQIIYSCGRCIQQEYIHVRPASDKRLIVVGDEVVASMRRVAEGDEFRSNLHKGASGSAYVPTIEECRVANLATKSLELPFCGVDIIDGPSGPLVLEVNPSPGFDIEKITDIPVTSHIAHYYNERLHDD